MARITEGVGCYHVPAIGVAMDSGITKQSYWDVLLSGWARLRQ